MLKQSIPCEDIRNAVWDELGNIYISSHGKIWVCSVDNGKEIISYSPNQSYGQINTILLTQKHLLIFYQKGRIELLIKFYPELLDQDSVLKPFKVDKFYENERGIVHALYNHHFTKILVGYRDGFLGSISIAAESNKNEE